MLLWCLGVWLLWCFLWSFTSCSLTCHLSLYFTSSSFYYVVGLLLQTPQVYPYDNLRVELEGELESLKKTRSKSILLLGLLHFRSSGLPKLLQATSWSSLTLLLCSCCSVVAWKRATSVMIISHLECFKFILRIWRQKWIKIFILNFLKHVNFGSFYLCLFSSIELLFFLIQYKNIIYKT